MPGDGLWSYEEDAYNPMNCLPMVQNYVARSQSRHTHTGRREIRQGDATGSIRSVIEHLRHLTFCIAGQLLEEHLSRD
jgi:hypothetical protein